jgi:hypothetical protein
VCEREREERERERRGGGALRDEEEQHLLAHLQS